MKENSKYHGVDKASAERGFVRTQKQPIHKEDDWVENIEQEMNPDDEQGYLERNNVFERI